MSTIAPLSPKKVKDQSIQVKLHDILLLTSKSHIVYNADCSDGLASAHIASSDYTGEEEDEENDEEGKPVPEALWREPATVPTVTELRFLVDQASEDTWRAIAKNARGVTVRDVLKAFHDCMSKPADGGCTRAAIFADCGFFNGFESDPPKGTVQLPSVGLGDGAE